MPRGTLSDLNRGFVGKAFKPFRRDRSSRSGDAIGLASAHKPPGGGVTFAIRFSQPA